MSLLNNPDRPQGVLTTKDRHYLFGDLDMSSYSDPENTIKQRRHRIRQRFEHALLDMVIANNLLSDRDQARVFDSLRDSMERKQFEHIMSELYDFLYVNLPVGHQQPCASLGIAKAYHRGSLMESGGKFNFRPTVEIQTPDSTNPADFTHKADIARYYADLERVSAAQPDSLTQPSELPEVPPELEASQDLFASPLENRGFDPEEIKYDNRAEIYQRRIAFLNFLDEWVV
jgi:hypothetical protein